MSKHCSVLMLLVRKKIYKVLAILLGMSFISIAGFKLLGYMDAPMFCVDKGDVFLGIVCLVFFVLFILCIAELPSQKSVSGYTYQRLQISEKEILVLDVMVNVLLAAMFYATEIIILSVLAKLYQSSPSYIQGPQGIIAAFYRSAFLHGMIPLKETGLWIRNILYIITVGVECACSSVYARYNSKSISTGFLLSLLVALRFSVYVGNEYYIGPGLIVIAAIIVFIKAYITAHGGKRRDEDESET